MRNLLCPCLLVGATMVAGAIVRGAMAGDNQSRRNGEAAAVSDDQFAGQEGESSAAGTVNLRLDPKSAEKIAEIVLVKVYGADVLKQRPWIVETTDTSFKFTGRLRDDEVGGVAEIEISKRNAAVRSIRHTK
jgi:hypothetical protein